VVFPEREEGKVAIKGDNTSSLACKKVGCCEYVGKLQENNPGISFSSLRKGKVCLLLLRKITYSYYDHVDGKGNAFCLTADAYAWDNRNPNK
jgi:hypothetical protein